MKNGWLKRAAALAMGVLMAITMAPEAALAAGVGTEPMQAVKEAGSVHVYAETPGDQESGKYTLQVNGTEVPVIKYSANGNNMDIARFACESGTPEFQVTVQEDINSVTVYPQRYYSEEELTVSADKHTLTFSMAEELRYAIVMINGGPADQEGKPYLALINDPPETGAPNFQDSNVLNFKEFSENYLAEYPNVSAEEPVKAGTTSGGVAYAEGKLVDNATSQVRFPDKRKMTEDDVTFALQAALDEIYKEGSPYDTLYFPAGTYTWSGLEIRNRKGKDVTIYLEEGALLKNRIQECMQAMEPAIGIWDSEDITISGRGMIDGNGVENYRKDRHDAVDSCHQGGVMIVRSSNITFNDTYVRDAKQWNWESHGSKHCTLNNIKGLTPYNQPWVDGLDMASAQDLEINGAFTLGNDDCFASGHYNPSDGFTNTVPGFDEYNEDALTWDTEDSVNISVKNTLGWSYDGGNGLRMGHNCYGHQMKNYTFDNINSVNFNGGGRGITVQNNTGEYPRYESIVIKNSSFDTTRVGANADILGKNEQKISEVTLENCYFNAAANASGKRFNFQNIENLTVKDLWVGGQKVSYTSDLDDLTVQNVDSFTFVNEDTPVMENHLPVISSPVGAVAAYAGNPLTLLVRAQDADADDTLTYTAELGELEGRASFDAAAKRFSWTPATDDIGKSYLVNFIVMDYTEKPVVSSVKITVSSSENSKVGYVVAEDTHVQSWGSEKSINYGGNPYLDVNKESGKGEMGENDPGDGKLAFLKFDLAQLREQKGAFDKAELSLTYIGVRLSTGENKQDILRVAEITDSSWIEGDGIRDGHTNTIDGAMTWNNMPQIGVTADAVKQSEEYNLGSNVKDKPLSTGDAIDGTRVAVDITEILNAALEDETKDKLSLAVTDSNGYEHYFVSKEGAEFYNNATADMAPSIHLNIPTDIDLEGPTEMTLTEGYAAAETDSFALKGANGPYTVTLSGNTGDGKITWNSDTQQIMIAEGLAKGTYEVTVTSTSTKDSSVSKSMTFTLTVAGLPVVTGVSVTPAEVSIMQGNSQIFTAAVTGENSPSQEVTWSVSGAVSTDTKIAQDGTLTVGSNETAETLTVTATSTADTTKSGTAIVTVTKSGTPTPQPVVTAVEVTPKTANVKQGEEEKFTAAVTGEHNPSQEVTWSVSGGVSADTEIAQDGTLTVGSNETAETLTVTATSTVDTTKSGTATVTVTKSGTPEPQPVVTAVEVTPKTANVKQGEEEKFTATVTGEHNPSQEVTWSVSGGVSADTKIAQDGTLTVGSNETAETLTVTATSTADTTKSGTATVTVTKSGTPTPQPIVTAVAVTPKTANVKQGAEQAFTAIVTGENNPSTEVVWSVSGAASADTKIAQDGTLTVGSNETAETLTVTATSKADTTKSGAAVVTVVKTGGTDSDNNNKPESADKTALKTAIAAAEALKEADYTADSWKVLLAALDAAKKAEADANATAETVNSAVTALNAAAKALEKKAAVEVKEPALNVKKITLGVKETFTLKVTNAPGGKIKYSSSKSKIASVNSKGKITAKKKGSSTITVTMSDGKKLTCKVTVKTAPKKISLNKKTVSLKKGKTFQIKVKLPKNTASYKITYKSNKKSVATVDATGKIKALKKGKATITVTTFNKKKATLKVTVK